MCVKMAEMESKRSDRKKTSASRASTSLSESLTDNLTNLSLNHQQNPCQDRPSESLKGTGAVSKKYKIRHPTDPLLNVSTDGRQKSPGSSKDKQHTLSTSDSHLPSASTSSPRAAAASSSSGSSPTSNSSSTLGRKKSSSVHGSSGGLSPSSKIHVVLSSRDTLNVDDVKNGITSIPEVAVNDKPAAIKQNKGQRTPKKEKQFETYMMLDEIQQGLKKGELIEGVLRINPKNFQDAYISVPGEMMDIYLGGILDRNRALNGDLVVVQLKPKEEWKILTSDLRNYLIRNNLDDASSVITQHKECTEVQNFNKSLCNNCLPEKSSLIEETKSKKKTRRKRPKKKGQKSLTSVVDGCEVETISGTKIETTCIRELPPPCTKKSRKSKRNKNKILNNQAVQQQLPVQFENVVACLDIEPKPPPSPPQRETIERTENDSFHVPCCSNVCQMPQVATPCICSIDVMDIQGSSSLNCFPVIDNFDPSSISAALSHICSVEQNTVAKVARDEMGSFERLTRERIDNWDSAAKNSDIAILQLEDLFTEDRMNVVDESDVLSEPDSLDGPLKSARQSSAVPPDELSEQDDSNSLSGLSSCSNELHQTVEDKHFFAANFASGEDAHDSSQSLLFDTIPHLPNDVVDNIAIQELLEERSLPASEHGNVPLLDSGTDGLPDQVFFDDTSILRLDDVYFPGSKSKAKNYSINETTDTVTSDLAKIKNLLLHKPLEKLTVDDVLELPNCQKFVQRTAKVVYILEEKHSRQARGYLKLMQDKNPTWALFCPTDHRMPRMRIQMHQCPKGFLQDHTSYANTLFIGKIAEWEDAGFAKGCLIKRLGVDGDIESETKGILLEYGINCDEFSADVLEDLPQVLPWKICEQELSRRRDFRKECVFTIDPATARDLDDAVSCEVMGNGLYRVGVHIADVSYFVRKGSRLDAAAASRATSVYLVQMVIPMLPRLLCEELCSLNPGTDRLTFSVEWTIREDGAILSEWFGKSVICTCAKLSYDHAQVMIENPIAECTPDDLPTIYNLWSPRDIKDRVLILHGLAVKLRQKRMDRGTLRLDQVKLTFQLDAGLPTSFAAHEHKESNQLIEEFMLLANMAVAHKIYKAYPEISVLRCHPPPQDRGTSEVADTLESFGIELDFTTAGSLQKSINQYIGNDEWSSARHQVIIMLLAKPMRRAVYFCSGIKTDEDQFWHYALNVPLYTHFTSPIRRYPDILVHRLLAASLGIENETELGNSIELQFLAGNSNDKKVAAKEVQELSSEIFLGAYIRDFGPFEEDAMVCAVMDHSFDVLVLKMGVVKRIYCEQVPDLHSKQYVANRGVPRLILFFRQQRDLVKATVTIFTMVRVVLVSKKQDPLKFQAFFKSLLEEPMR